MINLLANYLSDPHAIARRRVKLYGQRFHVWCSTLTRDQLLRDGRSSIGEATGAYS